MKNKKIVGYVLMILGLCLGFYLSFSMSFDFIRENHRKNDFRKVSQEFSEDDFLKRDQKIKAYNDRLSGDNKTVDPFNSNDYNMDYNILDNPDDTFCFISIPSIDLYEKVYLGASEEHLSMGLSHVDGTDLPVGGSGKRAVIAGHRGFNGDVMLFFADRISGGDIMEVDFSDKKLYYQMKDSQIIDPADSYMLKPIEGEDIITLLTCDPMPTFHNRLLVNFERVELVENKVEDKNPDQKEIVDKNTDEKQKFQNESLDDKRIENEKYRKVSMEEIQSQKSKNIRTIKYGLLIICGLLAIMILLWLFKMIKIIKKK